MVIIMKKIGFIDYFLDEWHANNYPEMIEKYSNGEMKVCYAYAHITAPSGSVSNKKWAEEKKIELLESIEDLVNKSDCIVVLSPDNPEMHEELCDIPLKSGKPVYIDKTFAPDKATAVRIFEKAEKYGTPCYSSSALRFSAELELIDTSKIDKIYSEGPASLEIYSIHQIEMIVCLMKTRAEKIMYTGTRNHPSYIIKFADGRFVECYHRDDEESTFALTVVDADNKALKYVIKSDYFRRFIETMIEFFKNPIVPVPHEQTIDVIGIRTAVVADRETPFEWIEV